MIVKQSNGSCVVRLRSLTSQRQTETDAVQVEIVKAVLCFRTSSGVQAKRMGDRTRQRSRFGVVCIAR